jgi:hypothetical protein
MFGTVRAYVALLIAVAVTSLYISITCVRKLGHDRNRYSMNPEISALSSGMKLRKWLIAASAVANAVTFLTTLAEIVFLVSTHTQKASLSLGDGSFEANLLFACRILPPTFFLLNFAIICGYFVHICYSLHAVTFLVISGKVIGDTGLVFLVVNLLLLGYVLLYSLFSWDKMVLLFSTFYFSTILFVTTAWYFLVIRKYIK